MPLVQTEHQDKYASQGTSCQKYVKVERHQIMKELHVRPARQAFSVPNLETCNKRVPIIHTHYLDQPHVSLVLLDLNVLIPIKCPKSVQLENTDRTPLWKLVRLVLEAINVMIPANHLPLAVQVCFCCYFMCKILWFYLHSISILGLCFVLSIFNNKCIHSILRNIYPFVKYSAVFVDA